MKQVSKVTCHVRDADDPAAEGASLQVKLSLRTPFPCQVVLDVTETGLLENLVFHEYILPRSLHDRFPGRVGGARLFVWDFATKEGWKQPL